MAVNPSAFLNPGSAVAPAPSKSPDGQTCELRLIVMQADIAKSFQDSRSMDISDEISGRIALHRQTSTTQFLTTGRRRLQ
jgi:hypothetical protein